MAKWDIDEERAAQPLKKDLEILSKGKCRRRMPPVGFRRIFKPEESSFLEKPTWGEVIFVNWETMFYTVQYMGCGLKETYSPVQGEKYKSSTEKGYNRSSRKA